MTTELLTSKQVILRIVTIIAVVEFSIMDAFIFINADLSPYAEALLDITLLVMLATPLIYAWVINPYIRARDNAFDEMELLIHKDLLTGLSNRHDIYCQLEKSISASVRHAYGGAVLLLDLDGLKPVNDSFGHDAGDEVLIEVADRLRSRLRREDIAGRLDGDKFVIIINHVSKEAQKTRDFVVTLAEQLIQTVSEPVHFNGEKLNVTARVGISIFGAEEIEPDKAMHDADIALTRTKQAGGGSVIVFDK